MRTLEGTNILGDARMTAAIGPGAHVNTLRAADGAFTQDQLAKLKATGRALKNGEIDTSTSSLIGRATNNACVVIQELDRLVSRLHSHIDLIHQVKVAIFGAEPSTGESLLNADRPERDGEGGKLEDRMDDLRDRHERLHQLMATAESAFRDLASRL